MKVLALICTILVAVHVATAYDFYVSGFGATANDNNDDAAAINAAIYAARFQNPAPTETARIFFNNGTYLLNNTLSAYSNCKNIIFDGRGATLVFTTLKVGFYFDNCDNITIQNMYLDYSPLPFTGGKVIAYSSAAKSIDVEIAAPHIAEARTAQAIITYDLDRSRFGLLTTTNNTLKNIDVYQTSYATLSQVIQTTPTQVLRVFFQSYVPGSTFLGQNVVVRYQVYQYNAINFRSSRNSIVKNTVVWSAPGMGFVATQSTDVTLDGYQVRRKDGRWMSTAADGSHFNNVRGLITIKNSYYEGMGDDAINIHNELGAVYSKNSTTIGITKGINRPSLISDIRVGDVLSFASPDTPFTPYATFTVTAVSTVSPIIYCNLDGPITNINLNDVVIVETIASAVIQNTIVRKNRARGILVNNRNTVVENCSIEETTGPAILMSCDTSSWWEGNCAEDVVIRNNRFYENNFGVAQTAGNVQLLAQKNATAYTPAGTFRNLSFINNTFDGNTYRSFMHIGTASNVLIEKNSFDNAKLLNPATETVIALCNSNNITVQYNTLTSTQPLGMAFPGGSCNTATTNLFYQPNA